MPLKEFEILRFLCENRGTLTQRIISEETGYSLGTVNSIITNLRQKGLVDDSYQVTQVGFDVMEPYKVRNAIILAAGMSTRFIPVSYELPKGLISVKGEVLIEREIRQLHEAGVQEIVVVVGYMMEKFFYLRKKYGVKLVVNNEYATKNTHSSIHVARDYLSNTYILCSDNYYPKNIFHQYEYRAFYCTTYLAGTSYVERAVVFNDDGLIYKTNKPSCDQWIMSGHAYLSLDFSNSYKPLLESYYGKPGVEGMYWENVWTENVEKIPLWVKKCEPTDILEFDSMDDLKAFDPDYILNNRVKVFENICSVLNCNIQDIQQMVPIKKGLSNQSFRFSVNGIRYVYRHPGISASGVVDRKKEAAAICAAKSLDVDDTLVYIDEEGWKISRYIEATEEFNFGNKKHVAMLAQQLKVLHSSNVRVGMGFDYKMEGDKIIEALKHIDALSYRRCISERESLVPIFEYMQKDKWQISLCHNDLYEPNLIIEGNRVHVIDWEFAGDADIGFDICKLFSVNNTPYCEIEDWLELYFERKITTNEKIHLLACAAIIYYYWYIWGIYSSKNNQNVSNYLIGWYDKMVFYRDTVFMLIK